jgi:hypothetical protein
MTLPKRGVEGRAFPKFFVLVTRCASFSAKLDAEVSIMHPRSSAVVACAVCILLSSALAFCSRERRDENELRPYTPLQLEAATVKQPADERSALQAK